MKYFIRFVGHLIQVPGQQMPSEVYYDVISDFDSEDMEPTKTAEGTLVMGLKQFCNMVTYELMEHGMIVPKFPNKTQDGTKVRFDQRMGVGKHMIAYIDLIVRTIAAPKPMISELPMFGAGDEAQGMPGLTGSIN
jgi:hypothetical protein